MPLDPIHTLRAAKRLHLKDGVFVSLVPPSVFEGHLRSVNGEIGWIGAASAVERGEDVLECWRQLLIPGLPIAGVDPLAAALRAVPAAESPRVRERLTRANEDDHRTLAAQALVECASLGVLSAIVDLTGASIARVKGTATAAEEVGLRCLLEWNASTAEEKSLAESFQSTELVRCVAPAKTPAVNLDTIARGDAVDLASRLSSQGGPPDALSLVRFLEHRERGLGFRCLANTYAVLTEAFGVPCGAFVKGAFFDIVFLDYDPPARLDRDNLEAFLTSGVGPWCVEASAVGARPVMRRHEVITADRAAVAQRVAEIVAAARAV